jgi:Tfp pilus assembly protein PilO
MKALFRKQLGVVIGIAGIFLFALLGLIRVGMAMKEKEARVQEIKNHVASYEMNKKVFTEETKQLQKIERTVAALEMNRITAATIPALLSSLEELAASHHVTFSITSVDTPGKGEEQKLLIDSAATGSYEHIIAFVTELLSQPYQVRFNEFSLYQNTQEAMLGTAPAWELLATIEVISF